MYKIPLLFLPQPNGGFTVTSALLPELITEGETIEEALENVKDALAAVIEAYEDLGQALPPSLRVEKTDAFYLETLVATS